MALNFKLSYKGETKRIPMIPDSFASFTEAIKTAYGESTLPSEFTIKYYDPEGDLITVASEEDFQAMMTSGSNPLKVFILGPGESAPQQAGTPAPVLQQQPVPTKVHIPPSKHEEETKFLTPKDIPPGGLSSDDSDAHDENQDEEDSEEQFEESPQSGHHKHRGGHQKWREHRDRGRQRVKEIFDTMTQLDSKIEDAKKIKTKLHDQIKALKTTKKELKKAAKSEATPEEATSVQEEIKSNKARLEALKEEKKKIKKYISALKTEFKQTWKNAKTPGGRRHHVDEGEVVHHGVSCDICQVNPIVGIRYKCTECPDYDLCSKCEAAKLHPHSFLKLTHPTGRGHGGHHRGGPHGGHHGGQRGQDGRPPWMQGGGPGKWGHILEQLQTQGGIDNLVKQYGPMVQNFLKPGMFQGMGGMPGGQQVGSNGPSAPGFQMSWDQVSVAPSEITPETDHVEVKVQVKNTGSTQWPKGLHFHFLMGVESNDLIPVADLAPGQTTMALFVFKNPKKVGKFESFYKLGVIENGSVKHLGNEISVTFEVTAGNAKAAAEKARLEAITKAQMLQEMFGWENFEEVLKIVEANPNKSEAELVDILAAGPANDNIFK